MPRLSTEQVQAAARDLWSRADYQRDLPAEKPPVDFGWLSKIHWEALGEPWLTLLQAFGWTVLSVLALLLLYGLWQLVKGYSRNVSEVNVGVGGEAAISSATRQRAVSQAEALAQQGRFAEAIHALLLVTLEDVVRISKRPLPKSFTSREVLAAVQVSVPARELLSSLVLETELCHFGGQPAQAADYARCLTSYRSFFGLMRAAGAGA